MQPGLAAQEHADARFEFGNVEGLDQVVVGAEIEPADAFFRGAAGSQDQNGGLALAGAHVAQHFQAVHFRQVEIEDDEIEILGGDDGIGGGTVMHDINRMPRTAQDRGQAIGKRDIVFGQQDAHGCFLFWKGDYRAGVPLSSAVLSVFLLMRG